MNLLIEDAQPQKGLPWKLIILIVLLLVVIALGLLYFYIESFKVRDTATDTQKEELAIPFDGTLFFTLSTIASTTGSRDIVSASLNVKEGEGIRMPIAGIKGESMFWGHLNYSKDANYATFLGLPVTEKTIAAGNIDSWNVYRTQIRGEKTYDAVVSAIAELSLGYMGDGQDFYREAPVVSENGDILYFSLSRDAYMSASTTLGELSAEAWEVYMLASDDTKYKVTNGMRPKWIDTKTFAYLKSDGVYVYDTTSNTEKLVFKATTALTQADGFDVSNDGSHFVLTTPLDSKVYIAQVESWEKATMAPIVTLGIPATQPVFSYDNSTIALLALSVTNGGQEVRSELKYYSLRASSFLKEGHPIDASTVTGIYLTDWQ